MTSATLPDARRRAYRPSTVSRRRSIAAAIAQIDREQLFYLRSHGLTEADAQRLVIEGFLQALVERFEEGPVREAVGAALERRLVAVLGD